jgi:hypothetical protein
VPVTVSGCGSEQFNGIYVPDGETDGVPKYRKEGVAQDGQPYAETILHRGGGPTWCVTLCHMIVQRTYVTVYGVLRRHLAQKMPGGAFDPFYSCRVSPDDINTSMPGLPPAGPNAGWKPIPLKPEGLSKMQEMKWKRDQAKGKGAAPPVGAAHRTLIL